MGFRKSFSLICLSVQFIRLAALSWAMFLSEVKSGLSLNRVALLELEAGRVIL